MVDPGFDVKFGEYKKETFGAVEMQLQSSWRKLMDPNTGLFEI